MSSDITAVGIDLGTTNSAAAEKVGEVPDVVDFAGERTMRSVVTFESGDDKVIVGNGAVSYLETDPDLTVSSIKREMGNDFTFNVDDDSYTIQEYTPEMISGLILRKVMGGAEDALGKEVDSAVITVPADFPEPARRATEKAAEYANIDLLRLLPEPSAACAAYGLRGKDEPIETVAVYDLGGGTFDISIVEIVHEADLYEVQGTDGNQKLGGDDFDNRLADHVIDQFEENTGVSISGEHEPEIRVKEKAKEAKHKLSSADEAQIRIPFLAEGEDLEQTITREKFEELTDDLVDDTLDVCEGLINDLDDISKDDIDTVLLVGGSSKMPQVQTAVEDFFGQEPSKEVNPDEAVAQGAAKQASIIARRSGLRPEEDDDSGELPPDDAGGIFDVAPDNIGIRLANGDFSRIIEKNETLPVKHTEDNYSTTADNQTQALVEVYQGDSDVAEENDKIEEFVLDNIREAPASVPNIAVEFELDENGVLRTEAWDKSVGDKSSPEGEVDISPEEEDDGGSDEEIARIKRELPDVQ
jgi:molecular chaperone DnaK